MSSARTREAATVALVGRPNVGKSTLFNRIAGTRRSIVAPIPGTTRDVIAEPAEWRGVRFRLVDTGGLFGASEDPLHELVVEHGRKAVATADLVVFLVDGRQGPVPGDEEIARTLHERGKPVLLAINKTDDHRARDRAFEFYRLGFDPVFEVSSEHGQGVADLLDAVVEGLKGVHGDLRGAEGEVEDEEVRVAIIGRPNVGKSSLVNRLLREERVIVSDTPGTTRDAVDTVLRWQKRTYRIVDTAGIRRPGKVGRSGPIESVSVIIARRAIERADVAVMLIDATEGATDQDGAIAGEAERTGCGVVIAANKWDLMKGRGQDVSKTFDEETRRRLKFLDYAPLLHVSALTGERTPRLLETIEKVAQARRKRIPTAELNRFLEVVTASHPVASPGKKEVRILYAAQTGVCPPQFVIFTNVATRLHFSYERFLVNRLREAFGFMGTPIRLQVRRRKSRDS